MRTDKQFVSKLHRIQNDIARLEQSQRSSPTQLANARLDLLRLCNYNMGVMFPYMFPNYLPSDDGQGQPLSLLNRPFGYSMTSIIPGSSTTVRAGRQAAKSTTISAMLLCVAHLLGRRMTYLAPHSKQLETFSRKVMELERACRFKVNKNEYKQNQYYKEYPNGSVFDLIYAYTSAEHARGKTTDLLDIDEAQNFDGGLFPEVQQIMKASKCPILNVAGTSLTVDTFLEHHYQIGSRGTWHIRLPGRSKTGAPLYLDCGDKDQVLGAIREKGLSCPHTGRLIDPRTGFFVHEYPSRFEDYHVSLHVPQIIIPDFTIHPIKWKEIWDAFRDYDTTKFLQEVMGIPTEQGARELTEDDLRRICTLGGQDPLIDRTKQHGHYKFILSGVDWGGSDYNRAVRTKVSWTVHVVAGVTQDGKIDLLHFRRYSGMGYRDIIGHILADHKRLNANAMVSDFGGGQVYNQMLRDPGGIPRERHLILGYVGPNSSLLSAPNGESMYNHFSLNRTESISNLFMAIKEERIRCYDWEQSKGFLDDFLNLIRTHQESQTTGATTFRYLRAGDKSDDILHTTNFILVLAKLMLGERMLEDRTMQQELRGRLAPHNSPIMHVPPVVFG